MGRRSSTFRTCSFTGHCFRYHVRKNKSGRYLIGSNLDTFCRNCIRSFQSEPGRTSVAFLKRVRSDIICLLSRTTSGSRFLLSIQKRRIHTKPACHDGCIFRCDHHHYTPFHNRCPHYHNGRNSFGCCNKYPGTRCRTASKQ